MSADRFEAGAAGADAALAEALDRFVEGLQDGREVDPCAELPDRPDLRQRVMETYELARALVASSKGTGGGRGLEVDGGVAGPGGEPARFGDYRLVQRLGAGGMGVVYVAEQESLHRLVALKLVHRGYAASESMRQRFMREAQAIARLRHPNIVTVYAIGEVERTQYIAMELLPGHSLDRVPGPRRRRRQLWSST